MREIKLNNYLLIIFFGTICSMLIGYLFTGLFIFRIKHVAFQFTIYGFIGSVLYSILKYRNFRDFAYILILYVAFDLIVFGVSSPLMVFVRILYALSLGVAILIYVKYVEDNAPNAVIRNLVSISGLLSISFLIAIQILRIIPVYKFDVSVMEGQTCFGLFIGFGLGSGFQLYYQFRDKFLKA